MKKSKKIIFIILAVILLVMFFPVRHVFKDGGSVSYESLIYEVKDYRSLPDENGEALRGKTIKILGFEVYNGTYTITIKK